MATTLVSASGHVLPEIHLSTKNLVNKSIALYGPSNSGKTHITKCILDKISTEVETIILVSPTEPSNKSFTKYVPLAMQHSEMSMPDPKFPNDKTKRITGPKGVLGFIKMVWDRQSLLTEIYKNANRPEVVKSLFERLPDKVKSKAHRECLDRIDTMYQLALKKLEKRFMRELSTFEKEKEKLEEKSMEHKINGYKHYIMENMRYIWKKHKDFTEDEQYAIHYIMLNPKSVIIFDDCAAQMVAAIQNKEEFRNYFYQNRHVNITAIFTFQDDTDLKANLRKNAFMSIYCTALVCRAYFTRSANGWPSEIKKMVEEYIQLVYESGDSSMEYAKFVYYRDDPKKQNYYYLRVGNPKEKMFGSSGFKDLCKALESKNSIDSNNMFYGALGIPGKVARH